MPKKTVYYDNAQTDDFSGTKIKTEQVGKEFPFSRSSFLWRIASFLTYFCFALPIVWIISKLYLGLKIEGKQNLRKIKGGYFLYLNHTRALDAFIPPLVCAPRRAYTIANPDAVSIPGIRTLVQLIGGFPLPTERTAMPKFLEAMQEKLQNGNVISIFPEAHIWPFCNFIRPFGSTSFRYPVKYGCPAVAAVTTYRKRSGLFRFAKKPGMTIQISEPFYPDLSLPPHQAKEELHRHIYQHMCRISQNAKENVEYIRYIKR